MRVFLSNLGCKLNQAEVDALARQLVARGHRVVASLVDADLHIVNSCTVTHQAARDSRKAARRAARGGGTARTVLTGCYATASGAEAATLHGVDLVVPNADKERLLDLVAQAFPELAGAVDADSAACGGLALGPARALIKVEDGCDMRCSFCVIPGSRGPQRSRPLVDVVDEAAALETAGHREIVVTGVQISSYRDRAARLPDLLDAMLEATRHCRFRLTSIAPWELDLRWLERFAQPRVCRHLHLSLQSGDDRTLRRMRRPYTASRFASLLDAVRRRLPGCAITTDVIAGFPGETDDEFERSLAFVAAAGFAKVHAFGFSAREGTAAAAMPDAVPPERRRQRLDRLLEVARASEDAFRSAQLGTTARVLWEGRRDGAWAGTSDNYLRIFTRCDDDLRGRLTDAELTALVPGGLSAPRAVGSGIGPAER